MSKHSSQTKFKGLILISTPIGNLEDISLRALKAFEQADFILCEDTRVTSKLLNAYSISKRLVSYNDHNAEKKRPYIIEQLKQGVSIALVSDAGTPTVSDPGLKLVQEVKENNLPLTAIPGPSAPIMALSLSGLPTDHFCFLGFLPKQKKAKEEIIKTYFCQNLTTIFFESAPRLQKTLKDILDLMGDRQCVVARELTKLYEEVVTRPLSDWVLELEDKTLKGEIVVLIEPVKQKDPFGDDQLKTLLTELLQNMPLKKAVAEAVEESGNSRNKVYKMALELKNSHDS